MAAGPERGALLIADLTGYTAYLSRGEIEHAPAIAGDLLETIVGRLEPPFRLAKLEGDAAFLFVEDGRAEGSLLLDAIEASYLAFRRRLRSIEQASTCDCTACSQAPRLDLKFFLHHGAYVRTTIAGRDELAGPSIIVVHRLQKGAAATAAHDADGRASGFAVLTTDALVAFGLDRNALGTIEGAEEIEHLGTIGTHVLDLERRWRSESERRRVEIADGRAVIDLRAVLPAQPATVWAHLTSPALRPTWEGPIVIAETVDDGRRGVGTRSRCVTGRLATIEEIVDWQPFDHVAYRLALPGLGGAEATYDLEPDPAGTAVHLRWAISGTEAVEVPALDDLRREKVAALGRLETVLGTWDRPAITAAAEQAQEEFA